MPEKIGSQKYSGAMANSGSGDSVLGRAARLLDTLQTHTALTPSDLSDLAGLPRTTGYRLITEMTELGLLHRSATGQIEPGQRLWEIAQRTRLNRTLRHHALPFMQDVNAVVRQTTQLAILTSEGVMIVERLSRHGAAVNPAEVAGIMPVHSTSMGHILLAFSPAERREQWLSEHRDMLAHERPDLRQEIEEARTRRHAHLAGQITTSTTGVSVPVLDARGVAEAALTIVVPSGSTEIPQFLMALHTASHGISRAMRSSAGDW